VQDALVQWWYGHNAVAFFLTTPYLGLMYYFLPKAANRPVFSYRLSIIHFWALIFLYIWAGPHHLLYSALPDWAQSLGMVFSLMLIAPSWGGMLNGLLTLRGAWDKVRQDPVLKFMVVAVTAYGMSTLEGPMMSIKSVNALSHFTDWTIAHVHTGALGWNGFLTFGMLYWLIPAAVPDQAVVHQAGHLPLLDRPHGHDVLRAPHLLGGRDAGPHVEAVHGRGPAAVSELPGNPAPDHPHAYAALGRRLAVPGGRHPDGHQPAQDGRTGHLPGRAGSTGARLTGPAPAEASHPYRHRWLERKPLIFTVLALVAILIGGLVEAVPTFLVRTNIPTIASVRPYTPLELHGRDLYIREGCVGCHSQMVRPFRSETERYGPYAKAGEFVYDHPFLWGSKRTGPDLLRVGKKYPDAWHVKHMVDPRSTSPGSIMPPYPWLMTRKLDTKPTVAKIKLMRRLGVPYPDGYETQAMADLKSQAEGIAAGLQQSGAPVEADREIIALIAYLQRLGTDIRAEIAAGGAL
jgi:cytochrome c oxidase cbb3-type subunit I/II